MLIVGTALFPSCEKEVRQVNFGNNAKVDGVNPCNPANYFDTIGIMHNVHLDAMLKKIDKSPELTNENTLDVIKSLYHTYLVDNNFDTHAIDYVDSYLIKDIIQSDKVKLYVDSISDSLKILVHSDYARCKNMIVRYENKLQSNEILTNDELDQLLAFTSVVRHSYYYWQDYDCGTKRSPRTADIALADGLGALEGASALSAFGIWGAIGGAVCGAVLRSCLKSRELKAEDNPSDTTATVNNNN